MIDETAWFHDPMCDPAGLRQRAWRYFRDDLRLFHAVNRVADVIEELRTHPSDQL